LQWDVSMTAVMAAFSTFPGRYNCQSRMPLRPPQIELGPAGISHVRLQGKGVGGNVHTKGLEKPLMAV
jgi:hypothetical protein